MCLGEICVEFCPKKTRQFAPAVEKRKRFHFLFRKLGCHGLLKFLMDPTGCHGRWRQNNRKELHFVNRSGDSSDQTVTDIKFGFIDPNTRAQCCQISTNSPYERLVSVRMTDEN
jgi:hypothetical protein